ncbi:MAG: response regulator [Nitrospirales bacterium]|nr:response regulator [Nitrospirales bacterium]
MMTDKEREKKDRVIWVVDDEPLNISLIEATFCSDRGILIRSSSNGREFFHDTGTHGLPDLLILDLVMPQMDGFGVLEGLKERREASYFPVIVLSGLSDKESVVRALTMGADDYLTKPFTAEELRARVYNMLKLKERDEYLNKSLDVLLMSLDDSLRILDETQKEVIFRLGRAAEFRDDDTGRHIQRVSDYAEIVAQKMGMPEEYCRMLKFASPMHDVGKIGLPDGVLLKAGRLSEQEMRIMMLHTSLGSEILGGTELPLLEMAREISLSHHERWDGTGYPLKLKGTDIPLSGRIVAIVDVFDALTSKRVYKPAWSFQEALVYIRDQKGMQFDPEATEAFLSVIEQIGEIKKKKDDQPQERTVIRQIMDGDITIEELVEKWR